MSDNTASPTTKQGLGAFFTLLFGQSVNMFGNQLAGFALGIWAYQQSSSVSEFSMITLATTLPMVLLSPFAGVLVDRWNRKTILLCAQFLAFSLALVLAYLFWHDRLEIWHIVLVLGLKSVANAFVRPAVMSSVPMMVPQDQLTRVNSIIALSLGVVQLIAPAIAGTLMSTVGIKYILLIDLSCFIVSISALVITRIPRPQLLPDSHAQDKFGRAFSAGFTYLKERPGLMAIIFLYAAIAFNISAISVLLVPMTLSFASEQQLGFITSAAGFGMILGGGLLIASGAFKQSPSHGVIFGGVLLSIGYILGPIIPSVWALGAAAMLIMGSFAIATACIEACFQKKVPSAQLGRVTGFRMFIVGGAQPIAVASVGPLADKLFVPALMPDGQLAATLGLYYGVGDGRGAALLVSALGAFCLLCVLIAWAYRPLRRLEQDLPDIQQNPAKEVTEAVNQA